MLPDQPQATTQALQPMADRRESPIPVPETRSVFPPRAERTFPLPRCASAIQIVRPLEAIAETQPQLHPALLRGVLIMGFSPAGKRSDAWLVHSKALQSKFSIVASVEGTF